MLFSALGVLAWVLILGLNWKDFRDFVKRPDLNPNARQKPLKLRLKGNEEDKERSSCKVGGFMRGGTAAREESAAPEKGHYLPPATEVDEEGDFVVPELDAETYDLDLMDDDESIEDQAPDMPEPEDEHVPAPQINMENGNHPVASVPWEEMQSSLKEEQDLAVAHKQFGNDDLWDQAVSFVREKGKASTSMLQRNFRIGYTRAARLIDRMEDESIIGPPTGTSKAREVIG